LGSQIEASFHNIVKERKEPYLDLWSSEKSNLSHPHKEDSLSGMHLVKLWDRCPLCLVEKGCHLGRLSNIHVGENTALSYTFAMIKKFCSLVRDLYI